MTKPTKLTKTRTSIAVAATSAIVMTARPIFPSLGSRTGVLSESTEALHGCRPAVERIN
jgi:hypothetical protein